MIQGALRATAVATAAVLTAGVSVVGADAPDGGFEPAGELREPRREHRAVTFPDGSVAIIGGTGVGDEVLASVETWDPATGAFSEAGVLTSPRKWHTATLLADGRVLVVGGLGAPGGDADDFLSSAELWDARAGTSAATGGMTDSRIEHTATLLADGRVVVVGGVYVSISPLASAEVWDAGSGSFSASGTLVQWRHNHTATALEDGRVLIVGGGSFTPEDFETHALAELWDPGSNAFSGGGELRIGRMEHSATLLADGRVLVIGGISRDGGRFSFVADAEVWDPETGAFHPAGSLAGGRAGHTATLLPDGRVLVIGGAEGLERMGELLADAQLWDPETETFRPAGSMTVPRMEHTADLLSDGTVLVIGGRTVIEGDTAEVVGTAERWAPSEPAAPTP